MPMMPPPMYPPPLGQQGQQDGEQRNNASDDDLFDVPVSCSPAVVDLRSNDLERREWS
jgi:hypothetical protein